MLRVPFVLLWNLLSALVFSLRWLLFRLGRFLSRSHPRWVHWKIPAHQTFGPPQGLAALAQSTLSFMEAREQVQNLCDDPGIHGVIVTADGLSGGPAHTADLAALVRKLKASGKIILFHSHSLTDREYQLAIEADQILLTPGGRVYLFGLRMEHYFAASLLERIGVAAQFIHIGSFKTAMHQFIHDEGTQAQRLSMKQLLTDLSVLQEDAIQERRGLEPEELKGLVARMPMDDHEALFRNVIDARWPRRKITEWIAAGHRPPEAPDPTIAEIRTASEKVIVHTLTKHQGSVPRYRWRPLLMGQRGVAMMDLSGTIVMPDMEIPGSSAATIDPREVLPVLRALRKDHRTRAVVLHINSPGGSALASEIIWEGISELAESKPVIAYCSDVAASGGYYMAVAAHGIMCQPRTITGSIGVIAGKFSAPGVLETLGLGHESTQRHEASRFMSLTDPLSEESLENLRRDARSFYRQFLRRVGQARQLPKRRLHRFARGRVYTGVDAHHRGLVDELGDLEDALAMARKMGDLPENAPTRFAGHRKIQLSALLRQRAVSAMLPSAMLPSALLPEAATRLHLIHAIARRDPLLALLPAELSQ